MGAGMSRTTRTLVLTIATASAATVLTATAVVAADRAKTGMTTTGTDAQVLLWRSGEGNRAYTTSTQWQELQLPDGGCVVGESGCRGVAAPAPFMVWAKGPISLTFSGSFSRAPVELRFRDGARVMEPGRANFAPHPRDNSFSFTFVSPRTGKRICQGPVLEWRSPTGQEVRLNRVTVVVHYKSYDPGPARCL
jgi:hypothetical protein